MKIKFPSSDKIKPIKHIKPGDVFVDNGVYFISLAQPTIHGLGLIDSHWAVRLEDGVLTKYGPDKLVQIADVVLEVQL